MYVIFFFGVICTLVHSINSQNINDELTTDEALRTARNSTVLNADPPKAIDDEESDLFISKFLQPCLNNQGYPSVETCVEDCALKNNEFTDHSSNINGVARFKVLHLKPSEFVLNNHTLHIPTWNITITNESYTLHPNNITRVCLPLTEALSTCVLDQLLLSRIDDKDFGHTIWLRILHKIYDWDEFFLNYNQFIFCLPGETTAYLTILDFRLSGSILSAIFLCLALILSRTIEELRKTLTLQCYMGMLVIGYIAQACLILMKFKTLTTCFVVNLFLHFSFMSAFFWMNVHAYFIYTAFDGIKTISKIRFLFYSIYCWGIPLIIAILSIVSEVLEISSWRPGFSSYCGFTHDLRIAFAYYYGWMSLSICINFILFVAIICKIRSISQYDPFVNKKSLYTLTFKILLVMGFAWIFELLVWAEVGGTLILSCFEIITSFQGCIIFFLYICRANILKKIMIKLKMLFTSRKREEAIEIKSLHYIKDS